VRGSGEFERGEIEEHAWQHPSLKEAITRRAPQEIPATLSAAQVKIQDDRLVRQAQVCLELPLPEQDSDLPRRLEAGIERGGQILKRRLFQHAIERADAELIVAQRHGKDGQGILCRGTTPFTFQAVFGAERGL
jgi:hypothetical protein